MSKENFDLLIVLEEEKNEFRGEELLGILELERALQNDESTLYIKESVFPNVILVELSIDPYEAVDILKDTPTTTISKAVPIDGVVKTKSDNIIGKIIEIATEKISSNDSFVVKCNLRCGRYIKSEDELINPVSHVLMENLNMRPDKKDPKWIIQIEVIGEDTGISVLNPDNL